MMADSPSCALAQKACRDGFTAFYTRAAQLFRNLAAARADGSLPRRLLRLARIDVLIVDDWAMAPLKRWRLGGIPSHLSLTHHVLSRVVKIPEIIGIHIVYPCPVFLRQIYISRPPTCHHSLLHWLLYTYLKNERVDLIVFFIPKYLVDTDMLIAHDKEMLTHQMTIAVQEFPIPPIRSVNQAQLITKNLFGHLGVSLPTLIPTPPRDL